MTVASAQLVVLTAAGVHWTGADESATRGPAPRRGQGAGTGRGGRRARASAALRAGGHSPVGGFPAALPPRPPRCRPGRGRAASGGPGDPLDQGRGQALGHRHRHLDGRPHDARGRRHAGQGEGPVRQGPPARPRGPRGPAGGGDLRVPRPRPLRPGRSGRQPGQSGVSRHGFPVGPCLLGGKAGRRRRCRSRRGGRGGHGHRSGSFSGRPLRGGARGSAGRKSRPAGRRT